MPCWRRRSLQFVPFSTLQYSTSAAACSGVPVPRLRPISGSVPTALHQAMNSLVPNWLVLSVFHALSSTRGRSCFGPDAVEPVVSGNKISAGITNDGNAPDGVSRSSRPCEIRLSPTASNRDHKFLRRLRGPDAREMSRRDCGRGEPRFAASQRRRGLGRWNSGAQSALQKARRKIK